jgi:hypothetical protein
MAMGARPHRFALSEAVAQAGSLVGIDVAYQHRGLRVFVRRHCRLQCQRRDRPVGERRHRVAQTTEVHDWIGGIAQRLTPLAQLLRA